MIHAQNLGEFWLIDLGSSNGTFVNKRRVQQPVRLRDSDQITLGSCTFVFRQPEEMSYATRSTLAERTVRRARIIECWLLVADIQDFTPLSRRLGEQELSELVGGWVARCKEIVETNNGTLNKYLGDGFLAYWENALGIAKDVANAVSILRNFQEGNTVPFRLALHLGPVSVGAVPSLGEVSLIGPEVNFVFRMEKLAAMLGASCLLSSAAHTNLGYSWTPVGAHRLKGYDENYRFFAS